MGKRVSLADIAESIGISKTVVSLVVNNKGDSNGISKETQERVKQKIKELNYRPNVLARGFRTGKTETIGLIVSDISNRFYSRIARQIEDLAWRSGYSVVICSTDENIEKEKKQLQILVDRQVDGLIVSSSFDDPSLYNTLQEEGFPLVFIDRIIKGANAPSITVDNYGGAKLATRHLIKQGLTDIMLIATFPQYISSINDRINGYISAMEDAGITIPAENLVKIPAGQTEHTVRDILQYRYQKGSLPQAIFTLNNVSMAFVIQYLSKLSIGIPKETALIGFDEAIYYGFHKPAISAIVQPIDEISSQAFSALIYQIEKKEPCQKFNRILPIDIAIRASSVK
jgi:DNA-binding LacI/PurR family transcriptional regulator